ncbi:MULTISPECIES: hypothetical protein [Tepidiphilus]|nr:MULTISPECIES: hypothetical protein [Tepidiphilus]
MNLLEAANPNPQIRFHATDFKPSHIAGARALAAEAGLQDAIVPIRTWPLMRRLDNPVMAAHNVRCSTDRFSHRSRKSP